ncbi:MAG: SdrD B-like domain-containing protein [Verrucomicrobiales bacterium]
MKSFASFLTLLVALFFAVPGKVHAQGGVRTVSGFAFVDADGDGEFDEGEEILSGVEVFLLDANGKVVATAVSGEDGTYTFPNVPFGRDYSILVQVDQNTFAESPVFNVGQEDGDIAVPLPVNEETRFQAPAALLTAIQQYRAAQNNPSNPKNQGSVSPFVP